MIIRIDIPDDLFLYSSNVLAVILIIVKQMLWLIILWLKKTFFFFLSNIMVSRLHLGNHFRTESKKWQMEFCFSFSSPFPFIPSYCQDSSLHSDGKTVVNEGRPAPPAVSLQFNYGAFAGLISIPQSWSSLSDR